ncbi:MAG: formylglycine-generating enzyme family protein [Gammaproteobacteria bacterium]|nr:formylglycine-generating enzyme family protein [Gammaproteobacteria bacterium]
MSNPTPNQAIPQVLAYEQKFGSGHFNLACHAAFAFILSPELLNLIHLNFLDDENIPWTAEADVLLSPLCHPVGEDLFQFDPAVRQVLLVELENHCGWLRLFDLANFLIDYLHEKPSQNSESEEIHRWLARAYIEPDKVIQELNSWLTGASAAPAVSDRETLAEQIRFTHIVEITSDVLEQSGSELYPQMISRSRELVQRIYRVPGTVQKPESKQEQRPKRKQNLEEPAEKVTAGLHDYLSDGKTLGPAMVYLPEGSFRMGSPEGKRGWFEEGSPEHEVALSSFSVGQYPVTFEEYDRFCADAKRKKPDDRKWGRARRPVIHVSWEDARAYCKWLSRQTGQNYRLLTEAEWEYACRAETQTRYSFGDEEGELGEYAWYDKNSGRQTHPAGEKKPSAWKLYDMHGNVWEWVNDYWADNYSSEPQTDPKGPNTGSSRVIRGGSWDITARICRSAMRGRNDPGGRDSSLGFRLARTGPLHSYPFTLDKKDFAEAEVSEKKVYEPGQIILDSFAEGGETGPEMVYIPAGKFMMGSPKDEEGRDNDEGPVHEVALNHFAIGKFPVTVKEYLHFARAMEKHYPEWMEKGSQYHAVTGTDERYKKRGDSLCDEACPIVGVSWEDVKAYCEWLSAQTGEKYALLTEAQWEYACRAGTATRYYFGDDEKELDKYAWHDNNADRRPQPVGEKEQNGWGLYDMHGNVWEWVNDYWVNKYISSELQTNPRGPESGSSRVIRGGGWDGTARGCRSAMRSGNVPGYRVSYLGFRLATTVP